VGNIYDYFLGIDAPTPIKVEYRRVQISKPHRVRVLNSASKFPTPSVSNGSSVVYFDPRVSQGLT